MSGIANPLQRENVKHAKLEFNDMWLLTDKVLVGDSGLMDGFRDCHCHLLPGVDDGVGTVDETLEILRLWEKAGVKEVWLTPHIMEDIPNKPSDLIKRFEELKRVYQGAIRMSLAAEHMMDGLFLRRLGADDVLPFGTDGTRLLVETSYYIPPMNMAAIIDSIRKNGYDPLLAHPERYQYMEKNDYKRWKQKGVLLQLNLPALVGAYGSDVQRKAEWLLRENMYDYCGTDTHSEDQMELFLDGIISDKTVKKVRQIAGT